MWMLLFTAIYWYKLPALVYQWAIYVSLWLVQSWSTKIKTSMPLIPCYFWRAFILKICQQPSNVQFLWVHFLFLIALYSRNVTCGNLIFFLHFCHKVEGIDGAMQIAAYLKSQEVTLEFIVDEGTVIVENAIPGMRMPYALWVAVIIT